MIFILLGAISSGTTYQLFLVGILKMLVMFMEVNLNDFHPD